MRANPAIKKRRSQIFEVASKNCMSIYVDYIDVYSVCVHSGTLSAHKIWKGLSALLDCWPFSRRYRTNFISTERNEASLFDRILTTGHKMRIINDICTATKSGIIERI